MTHPKKCPAAFFVAAYILFGVLFALLLFILARAGSRHLVFPKNHTETAENAFAAPTVILDAGHGGEDGGAIGIDGSYEKDLNLAITKTVHQILQINGIQTVLTREDDRLLYDKNSDYQGQKKVQDLATRRSIAESYDDAYFVSIHMNAFPQAQYRGLQVYYSVHSPLSKDLADTIQSHTKRSLQPQNHRSVKAAGSSIYLLDRLSCPAVLIECGFLSNPEECALLSDQTYQKQLAWLIAISIMENLSSADT